jgi:hypothetical protein
MYAARVFKRREQRDERRIAGLPEPLLRAAGALRLQVLRAATVCGLSALVGTGDAETVNAWTSWLDWLGTITIDDPEREELGVASDLLPDADLAAAAVSLRDSEATTATDPFTSFQVDWVDLLETLEKFARMVQRYGFAPLGEKTLERAGVDLLGVLEDSLILLAYGRAEDRASCASSRDMYELLRRGRADRTFARWDPAPGRVLPVLCLDSRAELQTREEWLVALECVKELNTTLDLYPRLQLDGERLVHEQRAEVRDRVRVGVLSMYPLWRFNQDIELPSDRDQSMTIRELLWRMRSLHRSLVVALSEKPEHRALAMSVEELRDPNAAGKRYLRDHPA